MTQGAAKTARRHIYDILDQTSSRSVLQHCPHSWRQPPLLQSIRNLISPAASSSRAWRRTAAAGGALGVLYALLAGLADRLLLPDVALRTDWQALLQAVLWTGTGMAVLGALVGAPEQRALGVLGGALASGSWFTARGAMQLGGSGIVLLYTFIPSITLGVPLAIVLRLLGDGFGPAQRSQRAAASGLAILLLAGAAGAWARMPADAVLAVRKSQALVQQTLAQPGTAALPLALRSIPDFRVAASTNFVLEQYSATTGPAAIGVNIRFDNGYAISCLFVSSSALPLCQPELDAFRGAFTSSAAN